MGCACRNSFWQGHYLIFNHISQLITFPTGTYIYVEQSSWLVLDCLIQETTSAFGTEDWIELDSSAKGKKKNRSKNLVSIQSYLILLAIINAM